MRILVTGAAGRIGARVVEQLARECVEVVAVDSRPLAPRPGVRVLSADLRADPSALERLVGAVHPTAIVHLAGLAGGGCEHRAEEAWDRNVRFTADLALAAAAHGVERFVFSSTSAVYDQKTLAPTKEEENVAPGSVYGRTKLAAEETLTRVAPTSDTAFTTLRIFNVYGPGMDASLCERLTRSIPAQPVPLTGWHNFYRDYLHADEVARALVVATGVPGVAGTHEIANVGSGVARSTADLVAELESRGLRLAYVRPGGEDRPSYSWADISRAADLLGFVPRQGIVLD
ncbi:MAG: NAD-dependent epimerase/dehydratase family protein [Sporichthyaceae bacterium]